MYQLLTPKFRFALFITQPQNSFSIEDGQALTCFADSYEIKEDGSIIFFQTAKTTDDKKFKIPVLAYPKGKWETCVFLDEEGEYPIFQGQVASQNNYFPEPPVEEPEEEQDEPEENDTDSNTTQGNYYPPIKAPESNDLDDLDDMFSDENARPETAPLPSNPKELKKMKVDWLEKNIKDYVKNNDAFIVEEFLMFISKDSQHKVFNPDDMDVIWTAANLLCDRMVLSRKFSNSIIQKTLGLILPDIMRRQWDGHMSPILDILQDREEVKNTTAIDLAVWMVNNNFN
jgi:hypothetical protein